METIQEIGSYAGFAAIVGLAVLSALYFSQARDVKRLREWAGRAPDREGVPGAAQTTGQPSRVVAQPIPKPPTPPTPPQKPPTPAQPGAAPATQGPTPPVPPGAPAATPATPAAAAAAGAGAAPAVAKGPAPATPAGKPPATGGGNGENGDGGGDSPPDSVNLDTVVHPPPPPPGETGEEDALSEETDVVGDDSGEFEPVSEEFAPADGYSDEYDALPEDSTEFDPIDPPTPPPAIGPPGTPLRPREDSSILPPYEEIRPGGPSSGGPGVVDRILGEPRRAVMLVGGALLVVAVIGIGVTQLGGDDDSSSPTPAADTTATTTPENDTGDEEEPKPKPTGVDPANVTVAVLNGTTVPGLAAQIGDKIAAQGFKIGNVTNSTDQQRAESVVLYAPGAEREAEDVGRRLKIAQREQVDPESQALGGDASVVVVTGADQTQ